MTEKFHTYNLQADQKLRERLEKAKQLTGQTWSTFCRRALEEALKKLGL